MNTIRHLMLLMLVLSSALVISANEVNISIYYIAPDPDIFTGGTLAAECGISSAGRNGAVVGCPNMNSPRLIDGVTGEGSSLSNTDQFVGWESQSNDTFTIAPEFMSDVPPRQVDIYFHNNPAMEIGLPPIADIYLGYANGFVGPISFTYANNQQLIESNDDTTVISVVITTDYVADNIPTDFTSFWLEFDFSSTTLRQALISEIEVFTEPVNITSDGEITFWPVSGDVQLGRENLVSSVEVSCSVAIDGQFSWSWTGPNGAALDVSHTSVLTADLTCTSILKINNLSLSDGGQYTCTASFFDGFASDSGSARSSTIGISTEGIVSTSGSLTATVGQSVSMTCDFSGYLPGNYSITWTGPQGAALNTSGRHAISIADGLNQSQSGGDSPGPSVLSTLTISNVEEADVGTYTCSMMGLSGAQLMDSIELIIPMEMTTEPTDVITSSTTSSSVSSTTASTTASSSDMAEESSQLLVIVGGTVGGVVVVAIVLVVTLVMVCILVKRKRPKLDLNDNNGLYSEVGVKPAPPPIPSYFYTGAPNSGYATIDIAKDDTEMCDMGPLTTLLPTKESIAADNPLLVKLSSNSTSMPRTYQDNPMYASADGLNHTVPPVSALKTAGSLPTLLDQDESFPSNFNIYASAHPPPIPSYHGTPEGSVCEEEIDPALFKKSYTPATNSSSDDCLAPYASIYSNPQPLRKSEGLLEVTERNIREIKELGMGQFGRVVLAHTLGLSLKELKLSESNTDRSVSIVVAVKRLKPNAEESTREAFEKEIKFMARLQHENVVRLLGICLSKNAFIMMQYMENGDLNQFLRQHTLVEPYVRPLPDDMVNVPILVYLSLQIASGMRYLSSLRYIHRDLATRNILVGQEFTVKIADFGMSRDLYDSYYYRISGRAILPIRWMANECFYGRFTEKTDVWAFGVTMWEIFTLCKAQPYAEMTDQEVIDDAVSGPNRVLLSKPSSCPEEVYGIMKQCWIHEPEQRIPFIQVHHLLHQVHTGSSRSSL